MAPSIALPSTATLHKAYGQNGGVTLRTFGGKLIITHVDNAEATKVGLKRGLEVLSMNNIDCSILSEASAQKLLESDEMVTFLYQQMGGTTTPGTLVTAVLFKENKQDSIGLGLKMHSDGKTICVGKVVGKAAATDVRTGMILKSINNFDCVGLNTNQAAKLLTEATGSFTVLTQVPKDGAASSQRMTDCVTATVEISEDEEETNEAPSGPGLEVMMVDSVVSAAKMILIKSIDPKGPYYGSSLRCGMQVLKIQNVDCTSASACTAPQVQKLLQDASQPGATVSMLAQDCSSLERHAPGSLMTVVVSKENADVKLGVVLAQKAGKLIIKRIADGTLGSTSELEPNMIVHSINNTTFAGAKAAASAGEILRDSEDSITFVVQTPGASKVLVNPKQLVVGTIYKESTDVKTGMAMKVQKGAIVITKIGEDSLTAETPLQVGMKILQITNVDLTNKTASDAAKLLSEAEGSMTILAQKPDRLPGSYVIASIKVPVVEEGEEKPKVGLKFKPNLAQAAFTVTGITEDSLAAGSELEEGMLIKSVNNVDVASKKTSEKVIDMFKVEPGSILNVLAVVPGGAPSLPVTKLVTAVVDVDSVPEGSLDYSDESGKITVTEIGSKGFLHGTALRSGMEILSINNIETSVFSKSGLAAMLKKENQFIFLAKRPSLEPGLLFVEVVHKENANVAVGIGLRPSGKKLMISSIKDGSLASNTKLLPGMELLSVDNEDCIGMDPVAVAKILKYNTGNIIIVASTKDGPITKCGSTTVSLVTALLEKSEKTSRVGVTFVRKGGKLVITKIAEDGLAADSDLVVGMEVLSINNSDTTVMPASEAAALLTEPEGTLIILAKRPSLRAGSFVTAAITKETPQSSIGIKLGVTKTGSAIIKSITSQSPASFTELEAGMVIKSINNVETTTLPAKEVGKLLGSTDLTITLLAQTTTEVAIGRASFTSMRSLTCAQSLADDTIASSYSGKNNENQEPVYADDMGDIIESPEDDVDATPVKKTTKKPVAMKTVSATPETMETITIIQGGRRQSLDVKNVVDC